MIISKSAFMKRGESSQNYDGYQAGVILLRDSKIVEEEGSFFLPGDQLVGGWAKVFRKDREHPVVARVRLQEYNRGKSTWAAMPGTMIRKVAIAQAFREAFPFAAEGMYTPDEMPDVQPQQQAPANEIKPVFTPEEEIAKDTPLPEPEPVPVTQGPGEDRLPWEDDQKDENESLFNL